jgi:hypothetical protein
MQTEVIAARMTPVGEVLSGSLGWCGTGATWESGSG